MLMQNIEGSLHTAKPQQSLTSDWSVPTRNMIAHASSKSATKIGVTAICIGSGVSTLARELALSYASIGKSVRLVDFSSSDVTVVKPVESGDDWLPIADHQVSFDLDSIGGHGATLPVQQGHIKAGFAALMAQADILVVDLPCVAVGSADAPSTFLAAAGACDLVYLVCLTGQVPASELQKCVEICRIGSVPIGGVILNDFNDVPSNMFKRREAP